jgi:aspartate kinase
MALIVQKYGGTSVGDAERIKSVARRITAAREKGNQVVVVVSAMGDTTDNLVTMAHQLNPRPDAREMDALLATGEVVSSTLTTMALEAMGRKAISLNGIQAGIRTDTAHSRARITQVDPKRILEELERDFIVVVAGFQGVSDGMDVTTLGRGGSDTTAVALAISLKAQRCEIYTDVEGVYTTDPNLIPEAKKLEEIGYEEMLELATYGAKVMHSRAVELAQLYGMPILVASSFSEGPGTLIHGGIPMEIRNKVRGIAYDLDVAKVTVIGVPDKPGIAASIFEPLSTAGISVDTIVQNASVNNLADLSFTVTRTDLDKAMRLIEPVARLIGAQKCVGDSSLAKVSIVGTGMQNTPGYAAKMFKSFYQEGVNIQLITTSEIRITCIIAEKQVKKAVDALHRVFVLEKEN